MIAAVTNSGVPIAAVVLVLMLAVLVVACRYEGAP